MAAFLMLACPDGGRADPILTPLVASGLSSIGIAGGVEILGTTIAYASIVSYTLTAGAVAHPTMIRAAR